jgi:hypothetical protein
MARQLKGCWVLGGGGKTVYRFSVLITSTTEQAFISGISLSEQQVGG